MAPRFFREALGWEFDECFVTDESDLFDFTTIVADSAEREAEVAEFRARFKAHYLLEAPGESTRIVELLEYLASNGVAE